MQRLHVIYPKWKSVLESHTVLNSQYSSSTVLFKLRGVTYIYLSHSIKFSSNTFLRFVLFLISLFSLSPVSIAYFFVIFLSAYRIWGSRKYSICIPFCNVISSSSRPQPCSSFRVTSFHFKQAYWFLHLGGTCEKLRKLLPCGCDAIPSNASGNHTTSNFWFTVRIASSA